MKVFRLSLLALALPVFVLISCEKEKNQPDLPVTDPNYFPLQVGKYVEYDVDSTYWDDFLALKTVHTLQMRYTVMDTFTDGAGRVGYQVDIAERKNETQLWQPRRTFYVTQTTHQMEWTEADRRFVKMVYPVENGRKWDGNQYISTYDQDNQFLRGWKYTYSDAGARYNTGRKEYNNTVTVNQVDETLNNPELQPNAYATRLYGIERYAQGVGLIQKEFTYWVYDPGVRNARKGYLVVMRAYNNN